VNGPPWALGENGLWAGTAAVGFAVLMNVPVRALVACGATGCAGFVVRSLLLATGAANVVSASFVAAIGVSLVGVGLGRRLRAPAVVFVIPGIIPLIPGALAFRTIMDVMAVLDTEGEAQSRVLTLAAAGAVRTTLVTAALAAGVAVPSMVLHRKRPML